MSTFGGGKDSSTGVNVQRTCRRRDNRRWAPRRTRRWCSSKRRAEKRSAFRHSPRHIPSRAGLSPQSGCGWSVLLHGQLARPSLRPVGDANSSAAGRCSAGAAPSPFHIDAWVVLLDHMHCPWTLPAGDADFPARWRASKTAFSKALPAGEWRSPAMTSRGERGIWQRRCWEHTIRESAGYQNPSFRDALQGRARNP
jgi:REP element-mobilizing transposase RayT